MMVNVGGGNAVFVELQKFFRQSGLRNVAAVNRNDKIKFGQVGRRCFDEKFFYVQKIQASWRFVDAKNSYRPAAFFSNIKSQRPGRSNGVGIRVAMANNQYIFALIDF